MVRLGVLQMRGLIVEGAKVGVGERKNISPISFATY